MRQFGLSSYEINVGERTRQAHVDHLKPRLVIESQREELTPVNSSTPGWDGDDPTPLVVVDEEEMEEVMNTIPSTNGSLRPQRDCRPPHRLIEELN